MNTKEQIAELRDIQDDAYEGYANPEQCGKYADTMEKLEAVYEAAVEISPDEFPKLKRAIAAVKSHDPH